MYAADILLLAQKCKDLESLQIIGDFRQNFGGLVIEGLSDTSFAEITKELPRIKILDLMIPGVWLSEHSFFSLARHCKRLTSCTLPACINLDNFVRLGEVSMLPKLSFMGMCYLNNRDEDAIEFDALAGKFLSIVPALTTINAQVDVDCSGELRRLNSLLQERRRA